MKELSINDYQIVQNLSCSSMGAINSTISNKNNIIDKIFSK